MSTNNEQEFNVGDKVWVIWGGFSRHMTEETITRMTNTRIVIREPGKEIQFFKSTLRKVGEPYGPRICHITDEHCVKAVEKEKRGSLRYKGAKAVQDALTLIAVRGINETEFRRLLEIAKEIDAMGLNQ